ncbi:MAG: prephenate dehydratase [Candidatus Pacebacteria bacterium]|nr:prephenate dehydratase [Candidatus Paceibacterota bacterium]
MTLRIGISGSQGSFSEQATQRYTQLANITDYTPVYLVSVANVLDALKNGSVERGIFPIENSNGGIVIEAVYAMAKYTFGIERLFEIDVHHCLLAQKGVNLRDITTIASHDQALKQCRMYLKRRFPDADLQEYADTAQSACDLGKGALPTTTAVIAPKGCATLYDLDVLDESIQDLKFNFTTFVVATCMSQTVCPG